jgi:hypothetical protein
MEPAPVVLPDWQVLPSAGGWVGGHTRTVCAWPSVMRCVGMLVDGRQDGT